MSTAAVARPDVAHGLLLARVRRLFTVLLGLLLVVEVVEWFDADSAVWPDRIVAAAALTVALAWALVVRRAARVGPLADAVAVASVVAVGWGLGRVGAVLALLLGITLVRALYGSRRSVVLATASLIAGYATVGALHGGLAGLLDLGLLTVAVALAAFAWVIRQVAEVLARNDLVATWDAVLTDAARGLLTATGRDDIERRLQTVRRELVDRGAAATGGLLVPPVVPELAALPEPGGATVPSDGELASELSVRLERLATSVDLAMEVLDSEARYRNLAERSRDGIYVRSVAHPSEFSYVNSRGRSLLGVRGVPGARQLDLSVVHADDRGVVADALRRGQIEQPLRVRLLEPSVPDGLRWVELSEIPARFVDGHLVAVQGTARDITWSRRQEEALERALDREQEAAHHLRELDEVRTTFLAAVSHELRTPLAGLLGASQTLVARRGQLVVEQTDELVDVVHRQAGRLQALLNDLLDIERLSRGLIEPVREPTGLVALVRDVRATFEGASDRVSVHGDAGLVLAVDRSQVERIVDNLVRNALKHTPGGTAVRVLVERHDRGATLAVEDDGPGVSPELRDGLFAPFVRGPDSATAAPTGTGIGLSLVSKFAELHGGRAWVEDADSGGARFVVLLAGDGGVLDGAGPPGRADGATR